MPRFPACTLNEDFFLGYSPERINPGDKEHRVSDILKVTSGSTPRRPSFVDSLYARVIRAGTFRASSIRVAEAAKVIENTQRDVNIALINELALIFNRMGLDTLEVLEAAGTKWNFLPFRPGLVGGHCIGVDPYYLTHKSQEIGYHPEMILAGRRINDNMGLYVASETVRLMVKRGISMPDARILVLGITFKENCPDVRNTRVVDVIAGTQEVWRRRWTSSIPGQHLRKCGRSTVSTLVASYHGPGQYDGIVMAVAHRQFKTWRPPTCMRWASPVHVIYDIKSMLPAEEVDGRL